MTLISKGQMLKTTDDRILEVVQANVPGCQGYVLLGDPSTSDLFFGRDEPASKLFVMRLGRSEKNKRNLAIKWIGLTLLLVIAWALLPAEAVAPIVPDADALEYFESLARYQQATQKVISDCGRDHMPSSDKGKLVCIAKPAKPEDLKK